VLWYNQCLESLTTADLGYTKIQGRLSDVAECRCCCIDPNPNREPNPAPSPHRDHNRAPISVERRISGVELPPESPTFVEPNIRSPSPTLGKGDGALPSDARTITLCLPTVGKIGGLQLMTPALDRPMRPDGPFSLGTGGRGSQQKGGERKSAFGSTGGRDSAGSQRGEGRRGSVYLRHYGQRKDGSPTRPLA
jgi:hypothetical protein